MLTKLIVVPDGDDAVSKRVEREVRKDHPASEYEIKDYRPINMPHLPCQSGKPYWVTMWEARKQK